MVLSILLVKKKARLLNCYAYIKYFKKGDKNMSFVIKDDDVLNKYNEIWNKVKKDLIIKLHSKPVYDEKYTKVKVTELKGVIKTNF